MSKKPRNPRDFTRDLAFPKPGAKKKRPKILASRKQPKIVSPQEVITDVKRLTADARKPGPEDTITAYREASTKKKIGMKIGTGWKSVQNATIKSQVHGMRTMLENAGISKPSRLPDETPPPTSTPTELENSKTNISKGYLS